jgi:serine/threonine-protein kinase
VGTRLGLYDILSPLGAGGMGEVYRAKDTKLGRDVALKILPASFTNDRERVARFRREAQVLASLNHPHIAQIYGLEEANSTQFLVLELVDGESLDKRIARGRIPVDEALGIAKQIAEALEAAHEKGIIHRDLKPANIALTKDGNVKVLDFGLAKAVEASGGSLDTMNSPTITSPAMMTGVGVILGTAAYMSPEQAKGGAADKRSDIWAFGCVLYEMLTGRRAFEGDDVADTLATVLKSEPDWTRVPRTVPRYVRVLVRQCLERNRTARISDMAVAHFVLTSGAALEDPSAAAGMSTATRFWRVMPWAAAVFATGLALVPAFGPWVRSRQVSPPDPARLSAELGADVSLPDTTAGNGGAAATISPDGRVLAFVGQKGTGGSAQLYVRRLDQLKAVPLAGTENAESPFFSPDGTWVAFFAGGKLKKVAVTGGAAVTLCDAPTGRGGIWTEGGSIVFAPAARERLMRVLSAGGTPVPATTLTEGEVTQRWPQVLPGGKAVLFTSSGIPTPSAFNDANLVVQPLPRGERRVVQRGGYYGRYVTSGHLVFVHDGTLWAAPFDIDRLEVTGPHVPLIDGVASNAATGGAQVAVSATGTLVYLPGLSARGGSFPIHWLGRDGKLAPLRAASADWFNLQFAPDGRRVALGIRDAQESIWVYEWAHDTLTRLTVDPADDVKPVWTPDGRRVAFASSRGDKSTLNLYWQRTDGIGDPQRLTESSQSQLPTSWHPSGRFLAFEQQNPQSGFDVMVLPVEGDEARGWRAGKPRTLLNSPADEREPMFSPDGRWMAYVSNETGRAEVYVRPFPGAGGKWLISTGGGTFPTWSKTKHELFYGSPSQQIMVAGYSVDADSFRAEPPRLWSAERYLAREGSRMFDLHPDGERFGLASAAAQPTPTIKQDRVTLIFNVFDELRRIAPVAKR